MLLYTSCNNFDITSPESFLKFCSLPANGLDQSISYYDLNFELKYIPSDYFLLKDNEVQMMSEKQFKKLKVDYDHSLYFIMTIAPKIQKR